MNPRTVLPRAALFVLLGIGIGWGIAHRGSLDVAQLQDLVQRAEAWGPLAFVAVYGAATVLFAPGSLFGLAGGALFGPLWGSLWNLLGATLGASLSFAAARYIAPNWTTRRTGGKLQRLVEGIEAEGWRFVMFVRLVPLFPFNLLNYALGLTRIPFGHYVAASAIAMVPGTIAYTWLGYAGREAATGSDGAAHNALIALAILAAVVFLPRYVRRLRRASAHGIGPAELKRALDRGNQTLVIDEWSNGTAKALPSRVDQLQGENP